MKSKTFLMYILRWKCPLAFIVSFKLSMVYIKYSTKSIMVLLYIILKRSPDILFFQTRPEQPFPLFFYCISLILFFLKSGNNFVLPPRFGKKGSVTIVYIWLLLFILEKWYALKQQLLLSQKLSFYVIILSKNFNATVQILTFFTQDMLRFSFFFLFFI